MLHPTVRIATLIAFGAALAGRPPVLAALGALCAVLLASACGAAPRLLGLLHRARWLLLVVVALHLVATPGDPSWSSGSAWSPSRIGIELAVGKLAVLVAMIAAVAALLETTTAAALAAGIATAAAPLAPLGFPAARLGARLAATLDGLGAAQASLRAASDGRGWAAAIAQQVVEVEARAANAVPVPSPPAPLPRLAEWSVPLALAAIAVAGRGA